MLTTCEDAIRDKVKFPTKTTGLYFRIVGSWSSAQEVSAVCDNLWKLFRSNLPEAYVS